MIKVYFVRHAQPEHAWEDDRTRPLTSEGKEDSKKVLVFLKDKSIDKFYCSPYKRSIDTISETAEYYEKEIITDERLREREKGPNGNNNGMFQKRWADLDFHEEGGESIMMVQERNIAALQDILSNCSNINEDEKDINIVIGTHGTALSSILNYYDTSYNCDSFLRMIDWMPYIIELDFENGKIIHTVEHIHVQKEFKGKERADKTPNIREINDQDFNGLMKLYMQLHDNSMPEKTEELNALWNQILKDKNHHIIVAEEDEKIVSSCVCVIIPNFTHNQQPYAFIENVITDEDYRKRGLATACLNYAKEIATRENCYKLMLLTGSKKEGTLNFYEQAGYNRNDKTAFIQWI